MVSGRVSESDGDNPVPHDTVKTEDCESGVDPLSTTKIIRNKANENRVFIALIVAGILGFSNIVIMAIQQPMLDEHQTFMIELNTANITKIDGKLDKILDRMP